MGAALIEAAAVIVICLGGEALRRWALVNGISSRWLLGGLGAVASAEFLLFAGQRVALLSFLASGIFVLTRGRLEPGAPRLARFLLPVVIVLFTPLELWLVFRLLP